MKYSLIALLILLSPLGASAQKNNLYADAGICLSYLDPGTSVTYDRKLANAFSVGAGAQLYNFHATETNPHQWTPAIYADMRVHIRPRKKSQFFALLDVGINFYAHSNSYYQQGDYLYSTRRNNGVYTGLGLGYFRRITKRGWGPYGSLKMIINRFMSNEYNLVTSTERITESSAGTIVVSAGFKF